MRDRIHTFSLRRPILAKCIGVFFVVFGFLALVTPLTPGGILFFVGLEVLGLRFVLTDKIYTLLEKKKNVPPPVVHIPTEPHSAQG